MWRTGRRSVFTSSAKPRHVLATKTRTVPKCSLYISPTYCRLENAEDKRRTVWKWRHTTWSSISDIDTMQGRKRLYTDAMNPPKRPAPSVCAGENLKAATAGWLRGKVDEFIFVSSVSNIVPRSETDSWNRCLYKSAESACCSTQDNSEEIARTGSGNRPIWPARPLNTNPDAFPRAAIVRSCTGRHKMSDTVSDSERETDWNHPKLTVDNTIWV